MKHQWINFICLAGLVILILSACQPTPAVTEAVPVATEKPAPPTQVDEAQPATPVQLGASVQCRVRQSLFPPVKEDEWILGPKDAKTTILEYSDFM